MKHARTLAVGAFAVAALSILAVPLVGQASTGKAAGSSGVQASVRVEGLSKTLLSETTVSAKAKTIDKDGKPADVCEGASGAVALEDATKGHWTAGGFFSGLGYSVEGIEGESYSFSSDYYWSLWIDNKPATTGICAAVHAKEKLLFFPQCSKESEAACPQGMFDPAVLLIKGPMKKAHAGKAVAFSVSSLANLTGKPSPGAGVKLTGGGHSVSTNASGKAKLTFAKAGKYKVLATAPNSVRDEIAVTVSR
ncbi:MAG TPA: hypothetical protein VGI26_01445 [Solirubrobacteraceae bacterium]|jgi:hypothetical protein